jgi:hypothetical protein
VAGSYGARTQPVHQIAANNFVAADGAYAEVHSAVPVAYTAQKFGS